MNMKESKILSFILIFVIISATFFPTAAGALTEPAPISNDIVLVDAVTGNVLYAKNGDAKAYPASTTKIMTVLLAIEAIEAGKVSLTDPVTAGSDINAGLSEDGSTAGIVPGETMTLESLLYCTMLSSANEACNIIAEYISGDVNTFVALMNARAKELGCTGTNFTNTHGLPDYNHYTTANDLAIIARAAYSHKLFMEICNTVKKTVPATNVAGERTLSNTNGLINNDSELYPGYFYEYASGIKTGHTQDAGYCLVSSAAKDGVSLLCVVLGGIGTETIDKIEYSNFTDSVLIYNWAFENYSYRNVLETTDLVADVPVKMGKDADYVTVHPETAVKALMPNDEDNSSFEQEVTIYSEETGAELVAPVETGEVLGEVTIKRDGVVYGTSKLVACSSVDLSYSRFIQGKIFSSLKNPLVIIFVLIVLGLLGTYIFLVVRYRASKKKYKKQMKMRRRARQQALSDRQTARNAPRSAELKDRLLDDVPVESVESRAERDYFDEFFGKDKK